MVAASGYQLAFTSQHGPIRRGDDAIVLNRVKVESGDTLSMLASLMHGGLDAWRWIDHSLLAVAILRTVCKRTAC
jgi:hypothetical protein